VDEVGQGIAVEDAVEGIGRLLEHALQPAHARDATAIRMGAEALGGLRRTFGAAHDATDDDLLRRLGEVEAATLAAHVDEPAFLAEKMYDLGQVVLGDVEGGCHFADRCPARRVGGEEDQHAQAEVGEARQLHGDARVEPAKMHSSCI